MGKICPSGPDPKSVIAFAVAYIRHRSTRNRRQQKLARAKRKPQPEDSRDALVSLVGQPVGLSSQRHVLVRGPQMSCVSTGSAGGDRTGAWCISPRGGDLSCAMVQSGYALRWTLLAGPSLRLSRVYAVRNLKRHSGRTARSSTGKGAAREAVRPRGSIESVSKSSSDAGCLGCKRAERAFW